jgi:uncharacterized RDD family membrane protein YckC
MGDETTTGAPAGLLRRLGALLYDLLLVAALAVVTTFMMLPLTHGEAILTSTQGYVGHLYHALLVGIVVGYFAWCWTRSGQTLGMQAWRIRLETDIGGRLGWAGALARGVLGCGMTILGIIGAWYLRTPGSALAHAGAAILIAPVVVNYGWLAFDPEARTLMDIAGRTRVARRA